MSDIKYETAMQNYFEMKNSKKCVGCNRNVKPIFTYENGIYYAICGHKEPCNLDIQIQKQQHKNIIVLIQEVFETLETIKQDIMELKVKFMFQFINEEYLLKEFKKLKGNLEEQTKLLETYTSFQTIQLSDKVVVFSNKINTCLEKNRELYDAYKSTKNKEAMKEMLENVIKNINPCLKLKRDLLYSYINVEESIYNKHESILVKQKRNENTEWKVKESKVIKYNLR